MTSENLMIPATKVAASLRFGDLRSRRIGSTAKSDTRQARRGVILVIVGLMLTDAGCQVVLGQEVLDYGDHLFVV